MSAVTGHPSAVTAGRGRTEIARRVIEKIAGRAASEVSAAVGRSGGLLGLGADADPSARPKVDAELSDSSVDLDIELGVSYPNSIRRVSDEVRGHVRERVHTLTGVPVHRVNITVTFLATNAGEGTPRKELR